MNESMEYLQAYIILKVAASLRACIRNLEEDGYCTRPGGLVPAMEMLLSALALLERVDKLAELRLPDACRLEGNAMNKPAKMPEGCKK